MALSTYGKILLTFRTQQQVFWLEIPVADTLGVYV